MQGVWSEKPRVFQEFQMQLVYFWYESSCIHQFDHSSEHIGRQSAIGSQQHAYEQADERGFDI